MKIKLHSIATITFALSVFGNTCYSQSLDAKTTEFLKQHVKTLSDDKMEGRETGTKGEKAAAQYITKNFKSIGLQAKGDNQTFLQAFSFKDGFKQGEKNALSINNKSFQVNTDFFPLSYSSIGEVNAQIVKVGFGIIAPTLNYDDYKGLENLKGKIFVIELSSPDGIHPHSKYVDYSSIEKKMTSAIEKGAAAIIFVNSDKNVEKPSSVLSKKEDTYPLPVIFADKAASQLLLTEASCNVNLVVDLIKEEKTANNVVGFIDNKAEKTVVIGAHYDHLGFGSKEDTSGHDYPVIHNGADDNASGVAGMIELARYYKSSDKKNNNYLFIAFSGEEKGLLGSNYFVKHSTIPLEKINYMVNLDMIGRLKTDEKKLDVFGTGTSPSWKPALEKIQVDSINVKMIESGIGASDNTSFYLKGVPAIHFFSGVNTDYHKPSDDFEKVNINGELSIVKYITVLINDLDDDGKLAFAKTKEDGKKSKRSSVSLGLIPDYAFEGPGMKVEGATPGKPAEKLGIKAGDILVKLGDYDIHGMKTYMEVLNNFKKGDKVKIIIKRGNENIEMEAEF